MPGTIDRLPQMVVLLPLLCMMVSWLRWRKPAPLGYDEIPVPPRAVRLLSFRLYGAADADVETLFRRRAASLWFKAKSSLSWSLLEVLRGLRSGRSAGIDNRNSQRSLESVLTAADYYRVLTRPPARAGGYAGITEPRRGRVVLGGGPLLLRLPWLSASMADHELTHCIQHVVFNAFDQEWEEPANSLQAVRFVGRSMFYELHAWFLGGPLFLMLVFVAGVAMGALSAVLS